MIASNILANPYPPGSAAHSYFHLWKLSTRQAAQAREAVEHHQEAAKFYFDQLLNIAAEGRSNVEIEATAVEVEHV